MHGDGCPRGGLLELVYERAAEEIRRGDRGDLVDGLTAMRAMTLGAVVRLGDACSGGAVDYRYRHGVLEARVDGGRWASSGERADLFMSPDRRWRVLGADEWSLSFGQAMERAMDGEHVACERTPGVMYVMRDGVLMCLDASGVTVEGLSAKDLESMWRVVPTAPEDEE